MQVGDALDDIADIAHDLAEVVWCITLVSEMRYGIFALDTSNIGASIYGNFRFISMRFSVKRKR